MDIAGETMPPLRAELRIFLTNWSESDLSYVRRTAVALANLARRARPPHDCCGHPGHPGC